MSSTFIANTSTEGLAPLGSAPQRSFELVSGTVLDALGPRHAALFAEPEGTEFGDRFDWYGAAGGKPRALETLDEDDRAAAEDALDGLLADISKLADTLIADETSDKQRLGEALANALRYPGPEAVYIFGSGEDLQPVLVNWAWVTDTQVAATGSLSGVGGKTAAAKAADAAADQAAAQGRMASAAPMPPLPRRAREGGPLNLWWLLWLGWLLLFAMICAILYLMIEACALRLPGLPNYCPPPGPSASELARDAQVLRDRIAAVERQMGIADRACQPQKATYVVPGPRPRFSEAGLRLPQSRPQQKITKGSG